MPTAVEDRQPLAPGEVLNQENKQRPRVTARFFGVLGLSFAVGYLGAYWILAHWMRLSFTVAPTDPLEAGAAFSVTSAAIYLLLRWVLG
jgi:hypothetical protein